jgi:hypothetical protein
MLFATVLSLFVVPSLYITVKLLESYFSRSKDSGDSGNDGNGRGNGKNGSVPADNKNKNVVVDA